MELSELMNLQGSIFLLMFLGLFLKKTGVITNEGRRLLTDLSISVTLPASIIKSFMIELDMSVLHNCMTTFLVAILVQFICMGLGEVLYIPFTGSRKKIMKYGTLCSNAGILGNAVAEGVYSDMGVLYASINLIPVRVFMWAVGIMYFTEAPTKKQLIKKVASHPCIIAVMAGLVIMIAGITFPMVITRTINSLANSNTAVSTIMVGSILADVEWKELLDKDLFYLTVNRLIVVPGVILLVCRLLGLSGILLGIPVIFANMPVASTTAILASKYNYDVRFATKCVVFSTLCSLFTTPLWCHVITFF